MSTPAFRAMIEELPSQPREAVIQFSMNVDKWRKLPDHPDDEQTFEHIGLFYKFVFPAAFPDITVPDQILNAEASKTVGWYEEKLTYYKKSIEEQNIKNEISKIVDIQGLDRGESFGFAKLNSEEKERIHESIFKIRKIIESSGLSNRKKNALFDKLNGLSREADAYGTSTDRFFAFMGDAAFLIGQMSKDAKPFFDEVKDMMKIVGRSRARQEGVSLPPGDEVLQLPGSSEGKE